MTVQLTQSPIFGHLELNMLLYINVGNGMEQFHLLKSWSQNIGLCHDRDMVQCTPLTSATYQPYLPEHGN